MAENEQCPGQLKRSLSILLESGPTHSAPVQWTETNTIGRKERPLGMVLCYPAHITSNPSTLTLRQHAWCALPAPKPQAAHILVNKGPPPLHLIAGEASLSASPLSTCILSHSFLFLMLFPPACGEVHFSLPWAQSYANSLQKDICGTYGASWSSSMPSLSW